MRQKQEIGYLCSRGHFEFYADPEQGPCASKKVALLFVEALADDDEMFYGPTEEADETGFVWYSSSGYSREDYQETVDDATASLTERITAWRANA